VTQVRGFADQQLRVPDKPEDASNRRVSIIVQYPNGPEPEEPKGKAGKEAEAGKEGEGGKEAHSGGEEGHESNPKPSAGDKEGAKPTSVNSAAAKPNPGPK
jgi:hypothetical protein